MINTILTRMEQTKGRKLSSLLTNAQQSWGSGDLEKAIALYQEMELLARSMPNWSFYAKNGLSGALAKAGRTEEARLKLGEAEKIAKDHPDILNGSNLKSVLDHTLQQIETAELSKNPLSSKAKSNIADPTAQTGQPLASSGSPQQTNADVPSNGIFAPSVHWNAPKAVTAGSVASLELVFKNSQPSTSVKLPGTPGVQFLGQPGRATSFEMQDFKTISTTTLTYHVVIQTKDEIRIPSFEVDSDKGKLVVASLSFFPSPSTPDSAPADLPITPESIIQPSDLPKDYSSLKESLKKESEGILPPDYSRNGQETDWDRECQGGWWPSGTEVGRYKLAFYQKVGRIWDDVAMIYGSRLQAGRIVITFRIQPDGSVADLRVTQGDAASILAQVVRPILAKAGGQSGSFSRALKKESPDGFEWQLAFRVDN